METGTWGSRDELVAVLSAAASALRALPMQVSRLDGPELDDILSVVDDLASVAAAGRFTIAGEADARGEVAASASGTLRQWLADRCPARGWPGGGGDRQGGP